MVDRCFHHFGGLQAGQRDQAGPAQTRPARRLRAVEAATGQQAVVAAQRGQADRFSNRIICGELPPVDLWFPLPRADPLFKRR